MIDVSTHNELAEPYAKGELYLKTPAIFKGYFGRPYLTAQALDEEGYYHTGLYRILWVGIFHS